MIKLISFDLDDTLWPITPMILQAEQGLQEWLGEQVPGYSRLIDRDLMTRLRDSVLAKQPSLRFDISRLRIRCIEQAIHHCHQTEGREIANRQVEQQATAAFEVFMQGRNQVNFYPGALDVLAELQQRYTLCGLTNGNADFRRIGLDKYFEFCMSPVETQARKPDLAIFAATQAHAGCGGSQIIHVGDHAKEDIGGAAAAGWRSVWVQHSRPNPHEAISTSSSTSSASASVPADAIITSLFELPKAIARIAEQSSTA